MQLFLAIAGLADELALVPDFEVHAQYRLTTAIHHLEAAREELRLLHHGMLSRPPAQPRLPAPGAPGAPRRPTGGQL